MAFVNAAVRRFLPGLGVVGLAAMLAAGLAVPAFAQQPAPAAEGAKKETPKADQGSAWVKLCEEQSLKKDADDKEPTKVNVCLTHHERFHPNTGQPLISAAIRALDNPEQKTMMIMVPLGRLLSSGLIVKVDEKEGIKMPYSYCTALGCVAEIPADDKLLTLLKSGKEMLIGTVDIARKRIAFKVPLNGFSRALDGAPIDRKVYAQARKEMFDAIRKRQEAIMAKAKEDAGKKQEAAPAPPKKLQ